MFESNGNSKSCKDGEGCSDGAQGGSSGHLQECEGLGAPGGGSVANRVPRPDGEALGAAHGGDDGGAAGRQRQLVARKRAPGTRKVDGEGVAKEGEGMASRTDWFIDGKLSAQVNPKDGFAEAYCKEARARRVQEFLVPLLYPEKPTRVIITMGNTIFGALSKERPID